MKVMKEKSAISALYILLALGYIVLCIYLPLTILPNMLLDDALFIHKGMELYSWKWLGPYGLDTLCKGPVFPFFLAINALLCLPVTLSMSLLYLFACFVLSSSLRWMGCNKYLVLAIFGVILFHPLLLPTRIVRENIYSSLALFAVAGFIRMMSPPSSRSTQPHPARMLPYGFALGLFWLTREEGMWILPGLFLGGLLQAVWLWRTKGDGKYYIAQMGFFFLAAVLPLLFVALMNCRIYGKFEAVDFNGTSFTSAIRSLQNIDVGEELPQIPVPQTKRQAAYRVSPTFAQLADFFEDPKNPFKLYSEYYVPKGSHEYGGGHFLWALRVGAALKGYYKNPDQAAKFYTKISHEIDTACHDGRLQCNKSFFNWLPPMSTKEWEAIPSKFLQAINIVGRLPDVPLTAGPSRGPYDRLQGMRIFLGNPKTTLNERELIIHVRGWYYAPNEGWIVLSCRTGNGTLLQYPITRMGSPDIAEHFGDKKANFRRFEFELPQQMACTLATETDPKQRVDLTRLDLILGTKIPLGQGGTLFLDKVTRDSDPSLQSNSLQLKSFLVYLYRWAVFPLAVIGFICFLVVLGMMPWRKALFSPLFCTSAMAWCIFFMRILLLVMAEITSFPAFMPMYISPAAPFLVLASGLSLSFLPGLCGLRFYPGRYSNDVYAGGATDKSAK